MEIQSSELFEDEDLEPWKRTHEANTISFIVKIWVEQLEGEEGKVTWRGSVTHVGTGERQFIKSLDEINEKIKSYVTNRKFNFE